MSGLRTWAVPAALLAIAAAGAIATQQSRRDESPVASVENPGPFGLRALYLYLEERGRPVRTLREPLTRLPEDVAVLVIAAPGGRELERDEVTAVEAFVRRGGTLVYLAPRSSRQSALDDWLGVVRSPPPPLQSGIALLDDPAGATAPIRVAMGAAQGVGALRISAGLTVRVEDALPIAEHGALWWKPLGGGGVWIAAGADAAENQRLDRLGNLRFWENLAARGPIAFDELHHQEAPTSLPRGLVAFSLQLLACGALFAVARGRRLGPPRPEQEERHRSSLEYLRAMAHLTRRAQVERELIPELLARLRRVMNDRLGIPVLLDDVDAARELERRCRIPASRLVALAERIRRASATRPTAAEYAALAREAAKIERVITGRARE